VTAPSVVPDLRGTSPFGTQSRAGVRTGKRRERTRARRRVWRVLAVLVLATMALTLAAVVVPRAFGCTPLVVRSDSMGDAYPVGSLAVARAVRSAQVDRGDVVLVERAGHSPVLHRVVDQQRSAGRLTVGTKGDANASRDPERYVLPARVPVALFRVPHLGYVVAFIATPVGWALLVVFPAALLGAGTLVQVWSGEPRRSVAWISWRADAYA
jgi:signal peptidase I